MQQETYPSLTVSIVVFKPDFNLLQKVLQHLKKALTQETLIQAKITIVNNGPEAQELEQLVHRSSLKIKLINNLQNTGYGAANNLVLLDSNAHYHLILNPDALLAPDALKVGLSYLESHTEVGLVCPQILNPDGTRQFVHRLHPTLFDMFLRSFAPHWLQQIYRQRMQRFELRHLDWEQVQDIPSPSGCCMLARTSVLKTVGGFDPRYFLYYEDSDLGRKILAHAKIKYLPNFKVTHIWARAARKSWRMKWIMIHSGILYLWKWGGWLR